MAVIGLCYCVTLWHISIRTGNISGTKYVLNDFPFRGPALYCSTAHDSRMTAAFRPGKSVVFLRYSDGGRKDPARKGQAHPRHFLRLHINFHRGHKTKRDALRPFYFRGFKSPLFKNGIYALDAGAHKGGQHKLLHAEVCALDGIFFAQVVHLIVLVGALGIIAAADADGGDALVNGHIAVGRASGREIALYAQAFKGGVGAFDHGGVDILGAGRHVAVPLRVPGYGILAPAGRFLVACFLDSFKYPAVQLFQKLLRVGAEVELYRGLGHDGVDAGVVARVEV